jgi:hypothetical protein
MKSGASGNDAFAMEIDGQSRYEKNSLISMSIADSL